MGIPFTLARGRPFGEIKPPSNTKFRRSGLGSGSIQSPLWNGLLIIGQSNGTGNGGTPTYTPLVSATAVPYENQPLTVSPGIGSWFTSCNPGIIPGVRDNSPPVNNSTLIPFVEAYEGRDTFDGSAGELVVHGESAASACANWLYTQLLANQNTAYNFFAINTARDGASYSLGSPPLNQGSNPYGWSKRGFQAAVAVYGSNALCRAIINHHGEADAVNGAATTTVTGNTSLPASSLTTAAFTVKAGITTPFGFANGGSLLVQTTAGDQFVSYTGATSGSFTGVSGWQNTSASIEAGATVYRADYYQDLLTWIANYSTDLSGITSQNLTTYPIQMYLWQQCAYSNANGTDVGKTALMLYWAWKNNLGSTPNALNLVCPAYFVPGSAVGGGFLHAGVGAQRWLGEMHAKAIYKTQFLGQQWLPLYITNVSRVTNVITLTYNVPVGSLTYDARLVHYVPNWGFTYTDSGGTITISSVAIASPTTVIITLSADPSANTLKFIRYGWGPTAYQCNTMGETRGNLRDSDTAVSNYGYPLYNWAVCSEDSVP